MVTVLKIPRIAKFKNSNFDISNIHVDELNLPSSLKSSSNSNTRILWLGPNNWLVFSSNLNLIESYLSLINLIPIIVYVLKKFLYNL